ncbi:uncharacterized protein METZ01_LOCUS214285, partial [marine metagenome]
CTMGCTMRWGTVLPDCRWVLTWVTRQQNKFLGYQKLQLYLRIVRSVVTLCTQEIRGLSHSRCVGTTDRMQPIR